MKKLFRKENKNRFILNIITLVIVGAMLIVNQVIAYPDRTVAQQNVGFSQLSYQGNLHNSLGEPLSGTFDITFKFYNHPTESAYLWEELHTGENAVPIESGLFNVMLGSLNPIPNTIWNEAEVYLGIQISSDSELTPREMVNLLPPIIQPESLNGNMIIPGTLDRNSLRNYLFYFNSEGIIALRNYQEGGEETTLFPADCQTYDEWCCNPENTICLLKQSGGDARLAFNISGGSASCWLAHNDDDTAAYSQGIYYATNNGAWPFTDASTVFFFSREGASDNPIRINATYDIYCFN